MDSSSGAGDGPRGCNDVDDSEMVIWDALRFSFHSLEDLSVSASIRRKEVEVTSTCYVIRVNEKSDQVFQSLFSLAMASLTSILSCPPSKFWTGTLLRIPIESE